MLAQVPRGRSSLSLPAMVTVPGLSGCRYWRWLPLVRTSDHPCCFSKRITSQTFGMDSVFVPTALRRKATGQRRVSKRPASSGGYPPPSTASVSKNGCPPARTPARFAYRISAVREDMPYGQTYGSEWWGHAGGASFDRACQPHRSVRRFRLRSNTPPSPKSSARRVWKPERRAACGAGRAAARRVRCGIVGVRRHAGAVRRDRGREHRGGIPPGPESPVGHRRAGSHRRLWGPARRPDCAKRSEPGTRAGLLPLARLVEDEARAKLDSPDLSLDFRQLGAADIATAARAYGALVGAEMDPAEARTVAGLE